MTEPQWYVPANLLTESVEIMRPHGRVGNEGLALWFGTASENRIEITHVVAVSGAGFHTTPQHIALSLRAMAKLTDLAETLDVALVGQIHSHPARLLELSSLDQRQGIRSDNYLSVVCPYYAQRAVSGFDDCGVHVFERQRYRRMQGKELHQRIVLFDSLASTVHCEVPA
jgi:proteasome lid subunit RPN8/RPN11